MSTTTPFLSSELLELIIFEARRDLPTLLSCARVCLAFLELVGPLIYENVEITREDQYRNLFSDRGSPISPQILPYLSLTQIKHLNILTPAFPPVFLSPNSRLLVQGVQTEAPLSVPSSVSTSASIPRPSSPTLSLLSLAISIHPDGVQSLAAILECFKPQELILGRGVPRRAQTRELGAAPRLRRTEGREDQRAGYGEVLKSWVVEGNLRAVSVHGFSLLGIQSSDSWLPYIIQSDILTLDNSLSLTFSFVSDFPSDPWERLELRPLFALAAQLRAFPNPSTTSPEYRIRLVFKISSKSLTEEVIRSVQETRVFLDAAGPEESTQHLGLFLRWFEGEGARCKQVICQAEEYEAIKEGRKQDGLIE